MSKTPSLTYQIQQLFNSVLAIGSSRHVAKIEMASYSRRPNEMGDKIHSYATKEKQRQHVINYARWCKAQHGTAVKTLVDIANSEMVERYIAERRGVVAQNTLNADMVALRRFQKILVDRNLIQERFVPQIANTGRKFSPRGAYTADEVEAIINEVASKDQRTAHIIRIQSQLGLRLREAVTLRSDHVLDRSTNMDVQGINKSEGVLFTKGKGGKQRYANAFDKPSTQAIQSLPIGNDRFSVRTDQKIGTQMRSIERKVKTACTALGIKCRGTHGFRAYAARNRLTMLLKAGKSKLEAEQITAKWLGHNRIDVLRHYLIDPKG